MWKQQKERSRNIEQKTQIYSRITGIIDGIGVDNFTDGGMVVGVDLEKGEIVTDGVTIDGTVFTHHPETNTKFRGFKIPYFKETLEMVQEAGKTISGYVGWDIAITENGPVLIEANIMPGNRILQMPYVTDRIGKRSVMERFL